MKKALKKCHDTAVGCDDIHYQFLKHLPFRSLESLLCIFIQIWHTGILPDSWKEAIVIPIPKPGKDSTNPANYRPIALTSCICKTMERMVNYRLVWFLEKNKLIAAVQSAFRKQRGTLDHLVRFETFIREAFIKKEHVVSVFFDLESAYDTTWKYGIMNDLHDFGIRGRPAYFISAFLNERQFRVWVGETLSNPHEQEQGSILSVTLFSVKINNIVKSVCPGVECCLYVDDFCICYRSKHMHTIERQLQQVLNNLSKWSNENGLKFSKTKTKCMHFCQSRKLHLDPELTLDGVLTEVVPEFKFLGLLFDSKLSFIPHINYLSNKCQKALNLLRVVSSMDWGADRKVLLRLYRTLARSKLDYGCIVYGSARQSYLRKLNDFKPLINNFIQDVWQQSWSDPANQNNKLFTIKPGLGEWLPGLRTNRREEIILAHLRIGHSHITHSYLLKGEEEPQCIPCNAPLTINHILINCVDLAPTRQRSFHDDSLTTLFDTVKFESLFDFLKEIGLYKKI